AGTGYGARASTAPRVDTFAASGSGARPPASPVTAVKVGDTRDRFVHAAAARKRSRPRRAPGRRPSADARLPTRALFVGGSRESEAWVAIRFGGTGGGQPIRPTVGKLRVKAP